MKMTVLLQVPDSIAEGSNPWENTFLAHVEMRRKVEWLGLARSQAVQAHGYDGDPIDYAPLFVCYGHQDDLLDGAQ